MKRKVKMVKKLRNKFVMVTTALMVILFGGFLIINTIFNNYWNEIEIVEMLDWIAYSGIFTTYHMDNTSEELIRDIVNDESPIAGIIMNTDGEILYTRVIGVENGVKISESAIDEMFHSKNGKRKVENYYYSYIQIDDETILLVVMNSKYEKLNGAKAMGILILIAGGVAILIGITFWLSRFVTRPAEQTLLREKQFISDAGHELKTPLGAISINAQALELEYEDDIYIKNIVSESKRMGRLLEKLLTLAKLDEQENIQLKDMNLSAICEEMSLTYESVAFEKKVELNCQIDADIHIYGNEDEVRQLLAILIDNAVKNTQAGRTINLKCNDTKRHKELRIENTGKGIPEPVLPYVFERFYTSDSSRTAGSFGLGLAIAKTIVERHKGAISVESKSGEKTVFRVIF